MISKTAHEHILNMISCEPPPSDEAVAREIGLSPARIIRLGSNENPLGASPMAMAAMHQALEHAHRFPDPEGRLLREKLAGWLGVSHDCIVPGNGSGDVMECAGRAFLRHGDEVVFSQYAYGACARMAQLFGAQAVEVPAADFNCDLNAILAAITPETRMVFLVNPNNPTGTMFGSGELDQFLASVPPHILVIIDEAYAEFLDEPVDTLKHVRDGHSVLVLRTFSKIWGLAGLRIGYGVCPPSIAMVLRKARQPFNANSIAQAGATACPDDTDHLEKSRAATVRGRRYFEDAFRASGIEFIPGVANFVMARVGDGDRVFDGLLERGLVIRPLSSYGLPEWIRVSVGTDSHNESFVRELTAVLASR